MGYLGETLTQVLTRAGGADVSLRDVTMAQMGNGVRDFGDFEKVRSWVLPQEKTVGFRLLTEVRPVALWRVPHVLGVGRWKSQNRKKIYLSYIEEPLNTKVIKSFVPELRSRKCFSCFEIPMFYVYMLRTFYVRFAYPNHGYGTLATFLIGLVLWLINHRSLCNAQSCFYTYIKYVICKHILPIYTVKWFIIIISCWQHGYPWPSLATPPYRSSP